MHAQSNAHELLRELRPHIIFAVVREGGPWVWTKVGGVAGILALVALAKQLPNWATVLFGAIAVLGVILGVIYTKKFRVQIENLDAKLDINRAMNFPSKLRVYLKNNSTSAIMAWSPRWEAGLWDVQREDWGRLQVEKYPGSWNVGVLGDWLNPESTEGRIETGHAFCACIALNRKVPDDELRRRLLLENVGTMVVPVEIKGKRKNWRIRL